MQLFRTNGRRQVQRLLKRLADGRTPVVVEVEHYNLRFTTVLALRRGIVLVARPKRLKGLLRKAGVLRLVDPEDPKRFIRMEIVQPAFIMSNGSVVTLCQTASEELEQDKRHSPRYNTSYIKNLSLVVSNFGKRYRIMDLSEQGCKVMLNSDPELDPLAMGRTDDWKARIVVGALSIDLAKLLPRSVSDRSVGCMFQVAHNGDGTKRLNRLLDLVQQQAQSRLQTEMSI